MKKLTAEELRVCRLMRGKTQGKLAREAGITSALIGFTEREERDLSDRVNVQVRQALKLSDKEIDEVMALYYRLRKKYE